MMTHSSRWWLWWMLTGVAALAAGAEKAPTGGGGASGSSNSDLNGVWRGLVVEGRGDDPNRGRTPLELTIYGNHIWARRLDGGGGSLGEGNYQISAGRPLLMDAAEMRAQGKGRIYQGICAMEADVLKWCVSSPGNKRPSEFQTKGQQFLLILKRQKEQSK
jgi:uncharacterized protein (TIGR03067 family)